jgi:hypothetical protein
MRTLIRAETVSSPDPNKRGVRSVFLRVAIVLGRKPSSNLTNPFG